MVRSKAKLTKLCLEERRDVQVFGEVANHNIVSLRESLSFQHPSWRDDSGRNDTARHDSGLSFTFHWWSIVFAVLLGSVSCNGNTKESRSDPPQEIGAFVKDTLPVKNSKRVATSANGSDSRDGSYSREQQSNPSTQPSFGNNTVTSITTSKSSERQATMLHDMDPNNDGWDSEVFASQAGKQIKRIGALLQANSEIDVQSLEDLVTKNFSCSLLRPNGLEKIFDDGSFAVRRAVGSEPEAEFFGSKGLAKAVGELRKGLEGTTQRQTKFKLIRVAPSEYQGAKEIPTTLLFESSGTKAGGVVQLSATWQCRWQAIPGQQPKLSWIGVLAHEEATSNFSNQTLFSDCTESIFESVPAYAHQLRYGNDYWRDRLEAYLGMYFDGHHGLALGDINGDGLDDLYICEPGGLPNRLFVQTENGSVRDLSADAGVDFLDNSRSALLLDLDNDGDQDLVLSIENRLKVFLNDGQGSFQHSASLDLDNQESYSISSADFDQDGDLDIYVCHYHGVGFEKKSFA